MSELGPTERRLLRALHAADQPSAEDRARIRAGVAARIGVASGAAVAIAAVASSANGLKAAAGITSAVGSGTAAGGATTFAGVAGATWKMSVVAVALASTAGGTAWWLMSEPAPDAARVAQAPAERPRVGKRPPLEGGEIVKSAPSALDAGMSSTERGEALQRTRERRSTAARVPSGRGSPGTSSDLEAEVELLGQAQRALKQGDSARALAVLEQHATEHPTGALATERAAARAVALCRSGRMLEGVREARRFLAENPKSPMALRVRSACFNRDK